MNKILPTFCVIFRQPFIHEGIPWESTCMPTLVCDFFPNNNISKLETTDDSHFLNYLPRRPASSKWSGHNIVMDLMSCKDIKIVLIKMGI